MNCELRHKLKGKIEETGMSLRKIGDATGVSFSTLSRFNRGADITMRNARRLEAWLNDEPIPSKILIHSRRLEVNGQVFLMTLELLKDVDWEQHQPEALTEDVENES